MKCVFFALLLLLFAVIHNAEAGDNIESFYTKIGRTVVRLEHFYSILTEGNDTYIIKNYSDGTGFFVTSDDRLYLVTARHVADTDHDLHARVKIRNSITNKDEILLLRIPRTHWVFHPDNGNDKVNAVDVAVVKLPVPVKEGKFIGEFTAFSDDQLPLADALPPDQVVTFGFPGDIGFKLFEQRPMGRFGIVAMYTGENFIKIGDKFANSRCSVLDIKVFAGNSGSPVFSAGDDTKLLGVLIASNSSDIAIMEPASRIKEVIDTAKNIPIKDYTYWEEIKVSQ